MPTAEEKAMVMREAEIGVMQSEAKNASNLQKLEEAGTDSPLVSLEGLWF